MFKKVFRAVIYYNIKSGHPDIQCIENPDETLVYEDTYTMDCDYYDNNVEEMINFIKHDLALVANGGYNTDHIKNVRYDIKSNG